MLYRLKNSLALRRNSRCLSSESQRIAISGHPSRGTTLQRRRTLMPSAGAVSLVASHNTTSAAPARAETNTTASNPIVGSMVSCLESEAGLPGGFYTLLSGKSRSRCSRLQYAVRARPRHEAGRPSRKGRTLGLEGAVRVIIERRLKARRLDDSSPISGAVPSARSFARALIRPSLWLCRVTRRGRCWTATTSSPGRTRRPRSPRRTLTGAPSPPSATCGAIDRQGEVAAPREKPYVEPYVFANRQGRFAPHVGFEPRVSLRRQPTPTYPILT
jgi:hypothetical protein